MNIQKWFLVLSLFFGTLLIIITPPFQAPDEYNHFFRTVGISNGNIISKKIQKNKIENVYVNFPGVDTKASDYYVGSYISTDFIDLTENISTDIPGNSSKKQDPNSIIEQLKSKHITNNNIFVSYPNTALYSPVPYIPSITAVVLAKIINISPLMAFYIGRLLHLTTYTLIMYWAIKILPFLKETAYLLALMPMSLFLAMSVSADSMVISLSFMCFALIANLYEDYNKKKINYLILVSFLLGASKSAYFLLPFAALIIFIKHKKFKALLPAIGSILGFSLWFLLSRNLFIPLRIGVAPYTQISHIINNPLKFTSTLFITLIGNRKYIINQFVGNLGWLDVPLNMYFTYFYISIIIISTILSKKIFDTKSKIINFLSASGTFLLISIMMYLSWTPIGHIEILGLVGKNFIPVALFGLSSFSALIKTKYQKLIYKIFLILPVPVLIYTISKLVIRYYI